MPRKIPLQSTPPSAAHYDAQMDDLTAALNLRNDALVARRAGRRGGWRRTGRRICGGNHIHVEHQQ